jgi:hypothetical protein
MSPALHWATEWPMAPGFLGANPARSVPATLPQPWFQRLQKDPSWPCQAPLPESRGCFKVAETRTRSQPQDRSHVGVHDNDLPEPDLQSSKGRSAAGELAPSLTLTIYPTPTLMSSCHSCPPISEESQICTRACKETSQNAIFLFSPPKIIKQLD